MHASIISKKTLALTIATIFVLGAVSMALTTAEVNAATKKATVNIVIQGGKEGKQGEKGEKGDPGSPGSPGSPGEKGETGATGATGAIGATGDPGPRGETGETGSPGEKGEKGDPGTVTINFCQANSEAACQTIEAEAGDNVTIGVNITHGEGQQNETTGGGGNETTGQEGNVSATHPIQCADTEFYNTTSNKCEGMVVVTPPENGTVITPPSNETVIVPPSNGTVIVPPSNATITPPENVTGSNETVITAPGNETSSGNESTTTPAPPVQCQPGTHEDNGVCVEDGGFSPNNNVTGGNLTQ